MNLDRMTIEIRPRRPWEAVDLGLLMARRWYGPLVRLCALLTLPFLLLGFLIPREYWYWHFALIWWALPLIERPLLYFLSQAVFDASPSMRECLRQFIPLATRQFFASMVWRRLSPSRSMDAPVVVLENLAGARRTERLNILHREDSSPASLFTFFTVFTIFAGYLSLFFFAMFFFSEEWQWIINDAFASDYPAWFSIAMNVTLAYVSAVIVTPFYVAGGFALYLNRRVRLEAWDVEIAFKRIAQKQKTRTGANAAVWVLAALLGAFSSLPETTWAQGEAMDTGYESQKTITTDNLDTLHSRELIRRIKERDDYHRIEKDRVMDFQWKWRSGSSDNENETLMKILAAIAGFLNIGLELIFWIVVLILVAILVYRYRNWLLQFVGKSPQLRARNRPRAESVFGLDLRKESLPDDVSAKALQLWNSGKRRLALSLLYRASLVNLVDRGLELREGDTELECLQAVNDHRVRLQLPTQTLNFFAELTQRWRQFAYGHIAPDESWFNSMCERWHSTWNHADGDVNGQEGAS